jgi:hypothetical protein
MVPVSVLVASNVPEPYVRLLPEPATIHPVVPLAGGNQVIVFHVTVTPGAVDPLQDDSLMVPRTLAEATEMKLKQASTPIAVNTKPLLLLLRILLFLSLSF